MKAFLLLLMIFLHIVDDFHLQGILAQMKQKSWWIDQINAMTFPNYDSQEEGREAARKQYKHDWIPALIIHSFSWTFMIMLPIAWYMNFQINLGFILVLMINVKLHALVDHAKANRRVINLVEDQAIHLFQVFMTWLLVFLV